MTPQEKRKLVISCFDRDEIDLYEIVKDFDGVHSYEFENDWGKLYVDIEVAETGYEEAFGVQCDVVGIYVTGAEFYDKHGNVEKMDDEDLKVIQEMLYYEF